MHICIYIMCVLCCVCYWPPWLYWIGWFLCIGLNAAGPAMLNVMKGIRIWSFANGLCQTLNRVDRRRTNRKGNAIMVRSHTRSGEKIDRYAVKWIIRCLSELISCHLTAPAYEACGWSHRLRASSPAFRPFPSLYLRPIWLRVRCRHLLIYSPCSGTRDKNSAGATTMLC